MDAADAKRAVIQRAEGWRLGQGPDGMAPARLGAREPPALLGHADPDHPLRGLRRGPRPARIAPITLPEDVSFDYPRQPASTGTRATCRSPEMRRLPARRETDTLDTRRFLLVFHPLYASQRLADRLPDKTTAEQWLPVGQYIGGVEHAILHLLLCALLHPALYISVSSIGRAVRRAVHPGHGDARQPLPMEIYDGLSGLGLFRLQICAAATARPIWIETGIDVIVGRIEKMSKSKKNTVDPRSSTGADATRWFSDSLARARS